MEKYYKRLSCFLITNKSIKAIDGELYEYAIRIFVQSFINIVLTIIIGIFSNMLKECFCIYLTFIILRKFTGGLHANKYSACLVCSTLLIASSLLIINLLISYDTYRSIFLVLLIVSTIIIGLFSPIEHSNKMLNKQEKRIYKFISIFLSLIILFLTLFLFEENSSLQYAFGLGELLVTTLITIKVISKKIGLQQYNN